MRSPSPASRPNSASTPAPTPAIAPITGPATLESCPSCPTSPAPARKDQRHGNPDLIGTARGSRSTRPSGGR